MCSCFRPKIEPEHIISSCLTFCTYVFVNQYSSQDLKVITKVKVFRFCVKLLSYVRVCIFVVYRTKVKKTAKKLLSPTSLSYELLQVFRNAGGLNFCLMSKFRYSASVKLPWHLA